MKEGVDAGMPRMAAKAATLHPCHSATGHGPIHGGLIGDDHCFAAAMAAMLVT